jgi:hypothetical protein
MKRELFLSSSQVWQLPLLGCRLTFLLPSFSMPWWMNAPSSMFFYGALYALFDRRLWQMSIVSGQRRVREKIYDPCPSPKSGTGLK